MDWGDKNYTPWSIEHIRTLFLDLPPIQLEESDETVKFLDVETTGDAGVVMKRGHEGRAVYELNIDARWQATKHVEKKFKIETTGSARFVYSSEEENPDIKILFDKIKPPMGAGPGFKGVCQTMQKRAKEVLPEAIKKGLANFGSTLVQKASKAEGI